MKFTYLGRPVEIEVSGHCSDFLVDAGNYTDGEMEDLSDEDLDAISDMHADAIMQELAEFAADRLHDLMKESAYE